MVALRTLWPTEQWWKLQAVKPTSITAHLIPTASNWIDDVYI